jgi:RNA polymerase subunit RPABC4/transcription elongation factor Spt4
MAIGKCRECGKEVSTKANACPHCGAVIKHPSWGTGFLVMVAAVVAITAFSVHFGGGSTVDAASDNGGAASNDTLRFIGAAGSYLETLQSASRSIANAENGVNNGSTTLGDIKDALSEGQIVENAGYTGDYEAKVRNRIPPMFKATAAQIDDAHRLFQSASTETLAYWDDQNVAHIQSGARTLKRSALTMGAAASSLNRGMATVKTRFALHPDSASRAAKATK